MGLPLPFEVDDLFGTVLWSKESGFRKGFFEHEICLKLWTFLGWFFVCLLVCFLDCSVACLFLLLACLLLV